MFVCMYVCLFVCMFVCLYVCMHDACMIPYEYLTMMILSPCPLIFGIHASIRMMNTKSWTPRPLRQLIGLIGKFAC